MFDISLVVSSLFISDTAEMHLKRIYRLYRADSLNLYYYTWIFFYVFFVSTLIKKGSVILSLSSVSVFSLITVLVCIL